MALRGIQRGQRQSDANVAMLATQIRNLPQQPRVTDGLNYQNALKQLLWFSGRGTKDFTNIPSAAKNNIEPDCDRWIAAWRRCYQSFNLDEASRRNSFFDRLCGDALELVGNFRTSTEPIDTVIRALRLRYAGIKSITQISLEIHRFARLPGENLDRAVNRLERLGAEYMAESRECDPATKNLLVWNAFLTLVAHPTLTEKYEQNEFTSRNIQEAVRLAQLHYDRHNLSPWGTRHIERELKGDKAKKTNAVTTEAQKCANRGCGGAHRTADCLQHGGNLTNIRTSSQNSGNKGGYRNGKPKDKPSGRVCWWCKTDAHPSRECPVYDRVTKHQKKAAETSRKGNSGGARKKTHRVNQASALATPDPQVEVSHEDDSSQEEPENC